jgi:aspartyl-tRNA(Asn)/glutamyl-tRNA(Gln) amidotransferase subunit C
MAKLTLDEVRKLALLARLDLTDDELAHYADEISSILGYIDGLQTADTDGLEPTYQVTNLSNVARADEIIDYGATKETLLKNAPAVQDGHFRVRRMVT